MRPIGIARCSRAFWDGVQLRWWLPRSFEDDMAPHILRWAHRLFAPSSDGLQPSSDGLQPNSDGLHLVPSCS